MPQPSAGPTKIQVSVEDHNFEPQTPHMPTSSVIVSQHSTSASITSEAGLRCANLMQGKACENKGAADSTRCCSADQLEATPPAWFRCH